MSNRSFVFLAVLLLLVAPTGLLAASYDPLLPLLVELAGWQAKKAEGVDLNQAGMLGVSVFREYASDERSIAAAIMLGSQVGVTWLPEYEEGFKVQSGAGLMEVRKINGFLVHIGFDAEDSSGGVVVLLIPAVADKPASGAAFALSFEGLALDDALKLAQKFDWKKMRDAAAKVK